MREIYNCMHAYTHLHKWIHASTFNLMLKLCKCSMKKILTKMNAKSHTHYGKRDERFQALTVMIVPLIPPRSSFDCCAWEEVVMALNSNIPNWTAGALVLDYWCAVLADLTQLFCSVKHVIFVNRTLKYCYYNRETMISPSLFTNKLYAFVTHWCRCNNVRINLLQLQSQPRPTMTWAWIIAPWKQQRRSGGGEGLGCDWQLWSMQI